MINSETTQFHNIVKLHAKFSLSFIYAVFLIIYSTVYYYSYVPGTFISQALTVLGVLASGIVLLRKGVKVNSKVSVAIFLFMLLFMIISNVINSAVWGSMTTCITMLSGLYIFTVYPLRKTEAKYLSVLFGLFVVAILLNCNVGNNFIESKFNPNSGGFVLAMLFCVLFTWFLVSKRIWLFIASIICIALQFVYISRTALLCCVLFSLLTLLYGHRHKFVKSKFLKRTVFILGILGVIIAFIYSNILFDIIGYDKVQIFGKDLFTGRENIWRGAFKDIMHNPIFGIGGDLNKDFAIQSGNALVSNAHNQSIGMVAAFGIPVFIAYYWFLSKSVVGQKKKIPAIVAVFIITFILMSYFDVYFFAMVNVGPILIAYCIINNGCTLKETE